MATLAQLDSNQVIRMVYDPATNGLICIPVYVDTTVLVNAVSAASNFISSAIGTLPIVTGKQIGRAHV